MSIKINFDSANNPESPTIVLARRNGDKIGVLNAKSIEISGALNDASEISFVISKYIDGEICAYWDEIVDFKLIYCVEWDTWFEITVEVDESNETTKTISGKSLGHAELSQIMLYNIEINTEIDIGRDDYVPTVLYNSGDTNGSLLHRIMEKARHYTIIHVDKTIANIQRTFQFDSISIYDAFQQIAQEIHCIFVLHSNSDENGNIQRTISVYDLESNCNDCGHRGEYTGVCPECGSSDINEGYGEDTNIFVTSDELAESIQLSTNDGAIKNCFKLEAGDDLMTATIRNCNPNGTDYIWYISDDMKSDMSKELVEKINNYDIEYFKYQKDHQYNIGSSTNIVANYNSIVRKYQNYNNSYDVITTPSGGFNEVKTPIVGYSSLMGVYYNVVDFYLYLQSGLMPKMSLNPTNAKIEANKLNQNNLSPVAISGNLNYLNIATANNAILSMAMVLVDSRYRVKINESSINGKTWNGNFVVTNYSNEEDTAISDTISVIINDNYELFLKQKLEKSLDNDNTEELDITGLFDVSLNSYVFEEELKKYSLNSLMSLYNACQSCIDILIEQGVGNEESSWSDGITNLYYELYVPYINKLASIEYEISVRQKEIDTIVGVYDSEGVLKTYGLQNYIENEINTTHDILDFEKYLGNDLWFEFCAFRRDDKYSNNNYISDGLGNSDLISKANEFIKEAQKEIYKSAQLQHSIESTLKNILTIKKFLPFVKSFKVGNWLRIMIDERVYKLRFVKYSVNYDNLDNIPVDFSDVVKVSNSITSIQEVIKQASTMATSYSSIQRQAQQGEESNSVINNWFSSGLNITNTKIIGGADNQTQTWDKHGMLFRKYDPITEEYSDKQLKIINSTLAITDDGWRSVKVAVGEFYYVDPDDNKTKVGFGINAEVLVGKLILGEKLRIRNKNGSLTFDENGFSVTNSYNTFCVNPNDETLLYISNKNNEKVLYADTNGKLYLSGEINAISGKIGGWNIATNGIDSGSLYSDNGYYRVWIHTPYADSTTDLNVFSIQKKITGSNNYESNYSVNTSGDILTQGDISIVKKAGEGHYDSIFAVNNETGYIFRYGCKQPFTYYGSYEFNVATSNNVFSIISSNGLKDIENEIKEINKNFILDVKEIVLSVVAVNGESNSISITETYYDTEYGWCVKLSESTTSVKFNWVLYINV